MNTSLANISQGDPAVFDAAIYGHLVGPERSLARKRFTERLHLVGSRRRLEPDDELPASVARRCLLSGLWIADAFLVALLCTVIPTILTVAEACGLALAGTVLDYWVPSAIVFSVVLMIVTAFRHRLINRHFRTDYHLPSRFIRPVSSLEVPLAARGRRSVGLETRPFRRADLPSGPLDQSQAGATAADQTWPESQAPPLETAPKTIGRKAARSPRSWLLLLAAGWLGFSTITTLLHPSLSTFVVLASTAALIAIGFVVSSFKNRRVRNDLRDSRVDSPD
jgi:uncharacterized membrane protein